MKMEFLNDISDGGKYSQAVSESLVRLYDFDVMQASMLEKAIREVVIGAGADLDLGSLGFIEPANCDVIFRVSPEDKGLVSNDSVNFVCELTVEGFQWMAYLLEPFLSCEADGYQWLYELDDCPCGFLFSPGGGW